MFYLFMALWLITLAATLAMLISWLFTKASKKDTRKKGKATSYLFLSSIVFLIVGIVLNANETKVVNDTVVEVGNETEDKIVKNEIYDYMLFEISFFDEVNYITSNEKIYEDIVTDIENYSVLDAYDSIKEYRDTLMANSSIISKLKVSERIPKEISDELNSMKTNISNALVNDYGALDSLLKYIDKGSIKELSSFKEDFVFVSPYIKDQKRKLAEIRSNLGIKKPDYEIIYRPKDTKAFYVKSSDTSNEAIFKILHDIKTSVDSEMSILWVYDSKAEVTKGKRPDESVDYVAEYISKSNEINYIDGRKTTIQDIFK